MWCQRLIQSCRLLIPLAQVNRPKIALYEKVLKDTAKKTAGSKDEEEKHGRSHLNKHHTDTRVGDNRKKWEHGSKRA